MRALLATVMLTACTAELPPWALEDPADHGFDVDLLDAAFLHAENLGHQHALLVQRDGVLVAEQTFHGWSPDEDHDVRSVSKSLMSAMIGIAIEDGLFSEGWQVTASFPDVDPADPRAEDITVAHLLEMRGGLPSDHDSYADIATTSDWIAATLAQDLVADPGAEWHYTTFGTHLLSGVLSHAAGTTSLAFAQDHLCEPAGITCEQWITDPTGLHVGGNGMSLVPRDMARFGQLYLEGGTLEGTRVVPADWVADTTTTQAGGTWPWGPFSETGYARLWWTGRLAGHDTVFALGHGGQYVLLVPDADVVVATTSRWRVDYEVADAQERAVAQVLEDVLRALAD